MLAHDVATSMKVKGPKLDCFTYVRSEIKYEVGSHVLPAYVSFFRQSSANRRKPEIRALVFSRAVSDN